MYVCLTTVFRHVLLLLLVLSPPLHWQVASIENTVQQGCAERRDLAEALSLARDLLQQNNIPFEVKSQASDSDDGEAQADGGKRQLQKSSTIDIPSIHSSLPDIATSSRMRRAFSMADPHVYACDRDLLQSSHSTGRLGSALEYPGDPSKTSIHPFAGRSQVPRRPTPGLSDRLPRIAPRSRNSVLPKR